MIDKQTINNPFNQLDLKTINDKVESITDFITDVTPDKNGLMLSSDKKKLDRIEDNANNYEHPLKHNADIITETDDKQFVSASEKQKWDNVDNKADVNHTHSPNIVVETEDKQFVSASEKQKWNNVDNKANLNHTHTMSDIEGLSLNAKDILIEDKNNVFSATNVEDALYEIISKQVTINESLIDNTKQIIDKLC